MVPVATALLWMERALVLMAVPDMETGSLRFKLNEVVVSLAAPARAPP